MNFYFLVTIDLKLSASFEDVIKEEAISHFKSTGIEEFNLEEDSVDEILEERSYSGGDVPIEVLEEVENRVKNQIETDTTVPEAHLKFYFDKEEHALAFLNHLKTKWSIQALFEKFETKDWNEEWRKHYKPIIVSPELRILPSWEKDVKEDGDLLIYPGMGFGTGSHETTFLSLKLYLEFTKITKSTLDFGCGSGILGLATFMFNKENEVDLYDIDKNAIENTKQNIALNNFENRNYHLYLPEDFSRLKKSYDLVFANILQNILLQNGEILTSLVAPAGHLIISGLLSGQEEEVINYYISLNPKLAVRKVENLNNWIAVIFESHP